MEPYLSHNPHNRDVGKDPIPKVNHLAEEMGEFLTSLASKTYLYSARRYVDLKSFVLAAIVEIVVRMTRSVNNKGF